MRSLSAKRRGVRKNRFGKKAKIALVIIVLAAIPVTFLIYRQVTEKPATPAGGQANSSRDVDETKVTKAKKNTYNVAADMPRILTIKNIGVNARVYPVGIDKENRVGVPLNIFDTGWYTQSAKPGDSGVSLIDGHISGPNLPAVFENLVKLSKGDAVEVERGDGSVLKYSVTSVDMKKLKDVNMQEILTAKDSQEKKLVLITCGGNFDKAAYTYDSRVIVMAQRIG